MPHSLTPSALISLVNPGPPPSPPLLLCCTLLFLLLCRQHITLSHKSNDRWVFKQLFDKDLVYRGFKVMPFSTACSTSLSNFEAGLNYKDVDDPAVMVS